jgi:hypothetical protein
LALRVVERQRNIRGCGLGINKHLDAGLSHKLTAAVAHFEQDALTLRARDGLLVLGSYLAVTTRT